jgi:hypothetical protein
MADHTTDGLISTLTYELGRNEAETIAFLLANMGGETDPPTLNLVTAEGPIGPMDPIAFYIEETGSYPIMMTVVVQYSDRTETIFEHRPLQGYISARQPYSASLMMNPPGYDVSVSHTGSGWPEDFTIYAYVHDGEANLTSVTGVFTRDPAAVALSVAIDTNPGVIGPSDQLDMHIVPGVGGIGSSAVYAIFDTVAELVWDGTAAAPGYTVNDSTNMSGHIELEVTRDAGWPRDFELVLTASEDDGLTDTDTAAFDVDPETPPPVLDDTPPVVANVTPTPGTPIDTMTPLQLDVTDNSGELRRVLLLVAYSTGPLAGVTELAHDGEAFVGAYAIGCTRDPITDGFRYNLLRHGGWLASPTLRVFAFDTSGNEV